MKIKELLKPNLLKILIFLFLIIFLLYFAGEKACGVGMTFAFCYKAYGFPFSYLVTGDIDVAYGHIKTIPLGQYFNKYLNLLFNPIAFIVNTILIYLLACFISMLFRNVKFKH